MKEFPHLDKAPIVEALIDFRVHQHKGFDAKSLESIHEKIKDRYPNKRPLRQLVAGLEFKDGGAVRQSVEQTEYGYRMESPDGLYVFQARVDGFTLSRLKPYETWEKLVQETRKMWKVYTEITRPERIVRTATRFINRIEIQLPMGKIEDFFTAPPAIPQGLPDSVNEFFSRIVIHDPDTGGNLIFTQGLEQVIASTNVLPFLVDIDVFKEDTFNVDSDVYWKLLDEFRSLKNRAFFASLTPKTIDLLK